MEFLYRKFIKDYNDVSNPKVIKKYGLLSGVVGMILNFVLFAVKLVVAIISGSISIISDAFNNLSDFSSSIMTIIGFKLSSKPADKEHPYGHQRMEYITALAIAFIILFIAINLGMSSFDKIIKPEAIAFNYVMLGVLIITVLIKLWMAIFYKVTSKKINSLTLKASYKDSINDVITTSVVIVGLFISKLLNFNIDGYLGLIVSLYIFISAISLVKETIDELIGGKPDEDMINKITTYVLKQKDILGVHDALYHNYGKGNIYMSMHIEMDGNLSLVGAHEIVDKIEENIYDKYKVKMVMHIDPVILDDDYNDIKKELTSVIKNISNKLDFHDLRINRTSSKIVIKFDLQVPYKFKINNKELHSLINKELKKIDNRYIASITFDEY